MTVLLHDIEAAIQRAMLGCPDEGDAGYLWRGTFKDRFERLYSWACGDHDGPAPILVTFAQLLRVEAGLARYGTDAAPDVDNS